MNLLSDLRRARDIDDVPSETFDRLVDGCFAEFSRIEWSGFYALNHRLWKAKDRTAEKYCAGLIEHAIETLENRK